jgi:hypothetical protein
MKLTRHPCPKCDEETIFTGLICSRCGYLKPNPLDVGWDKHKGYLRTLFHKNGKVGASNILAARQRQRTIDKAAERERKGTRQQDMPKLGIGSARVKGRTPVFRK